MINAAELLIGHNLRIISSDISISAPEGIYEQLYAQIMGWA